MTQQPPDSEFAHLYKPLPESESASDGRTLPKPFPVPVQPGPTRATTDEQFVYRWEDCENPEKVRHLQPDSDQPIYLDGNN